MQFKSDMIALNSFTIEKSDLQFYLLQMSALQRLCLAATTPILAANRGVDNACYVAMLAMWLAMAVLTARPAVTLARLPVTMADVGTAAETHVSCVQSHVPGPARIR